MAQVQIRGESPQRSRSAPALGVREFVDPADARVVQVTHEVDPLGPHVPPERGVDDAIERLHDEARVEPQPQVDLAPGDDDRPVVSPERCAGRIGDLRDAPRSERVESLEEARVRGGIMLDPRRNLRAAHDERVRREQLDEPPARVRRDRRERDEAHGDERAPERERVAREVRVRQEDEQVQQACDPAPGGDDGSLEARDGRA